MASRGILSRSITHLYFSLWYIWNHLDDSKSDHKIMLTQCNAYCRIQICFLSKPPETFDRKSDLVYCNVKTLRRCYKNMVQICERRLLSTNNYVVFYIDLVVTTMYSFLIIPAVGT